MEGVFIGNIARGGIRDLRAGARVNGCVAERTEHQAKQLTLQCLRVDSVLKYKLFFNLLGMRRLYSHLLHSIFTEIQGKETCNVLPLDTNSLGN